MIEDDLTCLHEAGHAVVAMTCGWPAPAVTVRGGSHASGCNVFPRDHEAIPHDSWANADLSAPFVLWPAGLRSHLEAEAVVFAAGCVAEELWAWSRPAPGRAVRVREPVRIRAAARITSLPPATAAEAADLAAVTGNPGASDEDVLARLARAAHGDDFRSASAWLGFISVQAEAILRQREAPVRRLADALAAQDVLGAAAVAAVLGR